MAAATPTRIPFCPRFYGEERAAGLIVLEDLGRGPSLVELLCACYLSTEEAALTGEAV